MFFYSYRKRYFDLTNLSIIFWHILAHFLFDIFVKGCKLQIMIEIKRHQPNARVYWRVYMNDKFVQCYDRLKDAKKAVEKLECLDQEEK